MSKIQRVELTAFAFDVNNLGLSQRNTAVVGNHQTATQVFEQEAPA